LLVTTERAIVFALAISAILRSYAICKIGHDRASPPKKRASLIATALMRGVGNTELFGERIHTHLKSNQLLLAQYLTRMHWSKTIGGDKKTLSPFCPLEFVDFWQEMRRASRRVLSKSL